MQGTETVCFGTVQEIQGTETHCFGAVQKMQGTETVCFGALHFLRPRPVRPCPYCPHSRAQKPGRGLSVSFTGTVPSSARARKMSFPTTLMIWRSSCGA